MFVCTGNICRSPMGELLMTHYLNGTTVQVSSAGTRGLPMHPIDPSSGRLMQSVGIESSGFRSRRLTRQMADEADLILCFEKQQRKEIVTLAPAAVRYTFLLDDFANMCDYCARNNMIAGLTIQERLQSVIKKSSMIRPMIPQPKDIADPHGREFGMFCVAAEPVSYTHLRAHETGAYLVCRLLLEKHAQAPYGNPRPHPLPNRCLIILLGPWIDSP